jgi:hypothetical protein
MSPTEFNRSTQTLKSVQPEQTSNSLTMKGRYLSDLLDTLSYGAGEGFSDQITGLVNLLTTDPRNTLSNLYQGAKSIVQNPQAAYQAAKQGVTEAMSSPQAAARFIGQNFSPVELANGLSNVGKMREMANYSDQMGILASGVGTVPKELFDKRIKGIGNLPESDLYDSAGNLRGDMQKNIWKLSDGTYLAVQKPAWLSKDKPMYVHADNIDDAITGLISKSSKSEKAVSAAAKKKYENSLQGLLDNEFGEGAFSFSKSERSKSQYITHNATGEKIRISDHALPLGYASADLDIPINLTDKEIFEKIKNHIRPDVEDKK